MSDVTSTRIYYETRELCHKDVYKHLSILRKSLLELRLASKKALLDNTSYWQQKVEEIKLEKDQELQKRLDIAEAENQRLRTVIENLTKSEDDKTSHDILLWEAENQIDQLSRQLDKKLIFINQLQLALAEQTKAMFELERSYALRYWRYTKAVRKENHCLKKAQCNSESSKDDCHTAK